MSVVHFDRDAMARCYAKRHQETDPGLVCVYYLPTNAPDREIRFIEVNQLIADREDKTLEPLDFGVDSGTETAHKLLVLDVTPGQWDRILEGSLPLPCDWSLDNKKAYQPKSDE